MNEAIIIVGSIFAIIGLAIIAYVHYTEKHSQNSH